MKRLNYLGIIILIFAVNSGRSQNSKTADGYLDKLSYRTGDTVIFYINTHTPLKFGQKTGTLFLYAPGGTIVEQIDSIDMVPQSIKNTEPWKNGYGYVASVKKWIVPSSLKSGYYLLKNPMAIPNLSVPVIIKGSNDTAEISIICPTNTINAYNNSGGKSLYISNSSDSLPATTVSFLRPQNFESGFFTAFNNWVYGKNYMVNIISDMDLDNYSEIENAKLLIIAGHSEYWTRQARLNFDKFVDAGKNVLILSGNTMGWQVRYSNDNFVNGVPVEDKTILTCHKHSGPKYDDDLIGDPLLKTYSWVTSSLKYPTLGSIGSDLSHGGYGVQLSVKSNPPVCDYKGFDGMKVLIPQSPLLKGGYSKGEIISFANGEFDGSPMKKDSNGGVLLDSSGAPQLDAAQLNFYRAEMVAYDQTMSPNLKSMSYCPLMAFQKTTTSGKMINVNSDRWCSNIVMGGQTFTTSACPTISVTPDSRITAITENMIDLLLADSNVFVFPSPSTCICPNPSPPATSNPETPVTSNSSPPPSPSPIVPTGCVTLNGSVNTLSIYPNPTSGIIYLNINQFKKVEVTIYNMLGEIIYQDTVILSSFYIDLTTHSNGVYFMRLMIDQGIIVNKKIVINH